MVCKHIKIIPENLLARQIISFDRCDKFKLIKGFNLSLEVFKSDVCSFEKLCKYYEQK